MKKNTLFIVYDNQLSEEKRIVALTTDRQTALDYIEQIQGKKQRAGLMLIRYSGTNVESYCEYKWLNENNCCTTPTQKDYELIDRILKDVIVGNVNSHNEKDLTISEPGKPTIRKPAINKGPFNEIRRCEGGAKFFLKEIIKTELETKVLAEVA